MTMLPAATAKPEIVPVADLVDLVMSGEYRVPRFQRPYVWSPDDMIQLFDSVVRGFPIGSLLIWQTDRKDITSLDAIGPIELPVSEPVMKSYVVDGHQRLATLLGVLRLPDNYPRDRMDQWRWWIAYDLRAEQFVHLKDRSGSAVPLYLLPLRSVLRTVDFARRTRELASSPDFSESEANLLLDRADAVQRAIRDYRIPMTVMRSGSLDDAVTIFARVNQRGRDMTPDQMVSALTFRDVGEGDFDLSTAIDDIIGMLREKGFGDLQRRIVLQVVLALAELDFTRPSYERIVNRDSHDRMRPAVVRAKAAMAEAADFLVGLGVRTSRLLPYASIMVMLSIYFSERTNNAVQENHPDLLAKWFWATSFNGWFAGANTTDLRQAGDVMRALALGGVQATKDVEAFFFNRPIRPFPESYDRRSARVRASLLVQIISGQPQEPTNGNQINGSAIFGDAAARDIPYFFPNRRRPTVSNPANRVILPEGYGRNAQAAFVQLQSSPYRDGVLRSHFISEDAFCDLINDNFEQFIAKREATILAAEQSFLAKFGLAVDAAAQRNVEEIDSDE
ncbi:6-hydroxypseudooxynicotine oxidase [Shinella sp. HZN7]|uniref:6-hydroxypseudooxynicotine oxidase n=1 Tax=Shinella sp. (strain HZN7) TaxID=879274 RepID=UPI00045638BC|nr:6-hydroxypseudooxynicotine oxidase [Shinella sp. HZN7]AGS16697.1 hypothetical protein [Shinella sp. HZN7]ANH03177.1 hypothetical protein shn_03395 [Shinella sp. HZN7]